VRLAPIQRGTRQPIRPSRPQIKRWRAQAAWSARAARLPRFDVPVHITATVHLDTRPGAHWDAANWLPTAKACVDGLVLHPKHGGADVLPDDCNCWVVGPDMRAGARVADARLVLTLRHVREAS
jgi:hypothetical protein